MNLAMWLNNEEKIKLATKLNCREDELSRVVKATILDDKTSRYYRVIEKDFDIKNWLISKSIAEIVSMRNEALSKAKVIPVT